MTPMWEAELERLAKINAGLRPQEVVDAARDPHSPLHDQFTWDDGVAGEKYRLWQARKLIKRVTIDKTTPDKKVITTQKYVSVKPKEEPRSYQSVEIVATDEDLMKLALEEMERDFRRLLKKWKRYQAQFDVLLGRYKAGDFDEGDDAATA